MSPLGEWLNLREFRLCLDLGTLVAFFSFFFIEICRTRIIKTASILLQNLINNIFDLFTIFGLEHFGMNFPFNNPLNEVGVEMKFF